LEIAENYVKASYITAQKIAKMAKQFSDGEFVKQCLVAAAEVLCPNKADAFNKISLFRMTVTRRVEELTLNVEETLKTKLLACKFYSLALDESTDLTDAAHLAIFIRGTHNELKVFEEMLVLCTLKGTTKGTDILEATKTTLARYRLSLKNLAELATDGAPAMVGTKAGLVALLKKRTRNRY
jgi:galactitol-specific phosphotransferase system IIB component